MTRIAIAGFHHETNTFSPTPATLADFETADGWPPLSRGPALLANLPGNNIPIAGFMAEAQARGWELMPLLWCSAQPSGAVEEAAFETIAGMILDDLKAALPVDAVYLDLHGAMVAAHAEDGEGELLRRIRALVGEEMPVYVTLDLHANISAAMVGRADYLHAYRHYPHTDMAESGRQTALALARRLEGAPRPRAAFRKLPFLIPVSAQSTLAEPAMGLYDTLRIIETRHRAEQASLSLAMGFPPADVTFCGPSVLAYAEDGQLADLLCRQLEGEVTGARSAFLGNLLGEDEAVSRAMALYAGKPVIIADTQDNPGAGASSDTMGMVRALLRQGAEGAVVAAVCDPEAARAAREAGVGEPISVALGGKVAFFENAPLAGVFKVIALADGAFTATGPMYGGSRMQLGPMALLEIEGVRIVVASRKQQAADRSILHHVGVIPESCRIIVLKSSVHFRADFTDIAGAILVAESPGLNVDNPARLPYTRYAGPTQPA